MKNEIFPAIHRGQHCLVLEHLCMNMYVAILASKLLGGHLWLTFRSHFQMAEATVPHSFEAHQNYLQKTQPYICSLAKHEQFNDLVNEMVINYNGSYDFFYYT